MRRRVGCPCPRWIKADASQYETEDCIYPRSVSLREMNATLPKHVHDCYEECPGTVDVTICWTRPTAFAPISDDPTEGGEEVTYGECSDCGCDDWTSAEEAHLLYHAED